MAKGLAVISGSNTIVFKALETGVIQMGSTNAQNVYKPAQVTVSGSFIVSGSEGALFNVSGSAIELTAPDTDNIKILSGLQSDLTSSTANDFVMIKSDGSVLKSSKIDADAVMLNDGSTVQDLSASISNQIGSSQITVVDSDGDQALVNLNGGSLTLNDVANRTVIEVSQDSSGVASYQVNLADEVHIQKLSASLGVEATGSIDVNGTLNVTSTSTMGGKLTISAGGADITGDTTVTGLLSASSADVAGNLTVRGDLEVLGDTTIKVTNQSNLTIEDAIILVGSGSQGSTADLGIVFGSTDRQSLGLSGGEFYLGTTTDDTLDGTFAGAVQSNGVLKLGSLYATDLVDAATLDISGLAGIGGDLGVSGSVTLGDGADKVVSVAGQLTASSGAEIQNGLSASAADIGGDLNVQSNVTVADGDLTVTGSVYISGSTSETVISGNVSLNAGRFNVPRLTRAEAVELFKDANGDIPEVDTRWEGYMFYLISDDGNDNDAFPQGRKWYFNENGYWHVSFFYVGN